MTGWIVVLLLAVAAALAIAMTYPWLRDRRRETRERNEEYARRRAEIELGRAARRWPPDDQERKP